MATETIGALLVRLLFDDSGFASGSTKAEAQFSQTANRFVSVAGGINSAITKAFAASAAAVTGFVTASAVIGAGFERQIDVVGAISNATTQELEQLESRARELGATTTFTATQAGEALAVLAQAGKSVEESLTISGDALAFARAQSTGLAEATELLVATTNTFPDVAGDSARAADILTTASQRTQLNFQRLNDSLTFAGPIASAFGVTLEETTAALGAFADIGLPASVAGTTFRQTLVEAAKATDEQKAILAELGLTIEDINPQTQKFTGIIENLATTNITAAQAVELFGTRAGGSVATLIDATREGRVNIRELTTEIEQSAGRTAATVERLNDNVATQAEIVRSAVEDVFISTFAAINDPLKQVLEALGPFFNTVSEAVAETSDRIEQTLLPAVSRFTSALADEGPAAANAFAGALTLAADIAAALLNTLTLLIRAFGTLSRAISALGLGGLVRDLAALAAIISTLGTAVGALTTAIGFAGGASGLSAATAGLGTVVAALGGPFGAAAAAVGLVTVAFIQYAVAAREGEEATLALAAAIESVAQRNAQLVANLRGGAATDDLVAGTQAFVEQQRAAVVAGEDLSDVLVTEIDQLEQLRDLTAEEIDLQIASGDLVTVGGQLRTVAGIVEDLDPEGFRALEQAAATFNREAVAIERNLVGVRDRLNEARESQAEFGRFGQAFEFGTEAATVEFIRQQEERADAARRAQENIARQRQEAERELLAREQRAEEERTRVAQREANRRAAVAEREADARIKAAQRAADGIRAALERAQDEAAGLFLGEPEQVRRDLLRQEADLRQTLNAFLEAFSGTEEQRQAVIADADEAVEQLRANAAERLRLIDEESLQRSLDAAQARRDGVVAFTEDEVSESEQIRRDSQALQTQIEEQAEAERQAIRDRFAALAARPGVSGRQVIELKRTETAQLAALDRELAEQRVAINEVANERIILADNRLRAEQDQARRDALEAEADTFRERVNLFEVAAADLQAVQERINAARLAGQEDLVAALQEEERRIQGDVEQFASAILDQIRNEPGPIARAFGGVFDPLIVKFPQVTRLFADLQKFALSTANAISGGFRAVGDVVSQVTGGFDIGIQSAVEAAQSATGEAADAVVDIEQQLADLQQELADASTLEDRQRILDEIAEQRAALSDARSELATGAAGAEIVNSAIDRALLVADNLGANLEAALTTFGERLPDVFQSVSSGLVEAARALATTLAPVVQSLVESIPSLVRGLARAATLLVGALPDILSALLSGIPRVITSLVRAIDDVIQALAEALPGIITAIVESVPDIISAIIRAIPSIVLSLIAALPDILEALLLGVVELIPAVVEGLIDGLFGPDGLVSQLPAIVFALVRLVVVEIPRIAIRLVGAIFTELIPGLVRAAGTFVSSLFTDLIPGLITAARDFVSSIFTDFFPNMIEAAGRFLANLRDGAIDLARRVGNTILDVLTVGVAGLFRNNEQEDADGAGRARGGGDGIFRGGGLADDIEAATAGLVGGLAQGIANGVGDLFRGQGAQGGVPFLSRTVGTLVHPGEAILDAATNRERLFGAPARTRDNPVSAAAAPFPTGTANPFAGLRLQVSIGDRDLDRFQVEADQRGGLALSNKASRRKTGTKVGFKRPGQK